MGDRREARGNRRRLGAALAVALLVLVAAACDPRPPEGVAVLYRVNAGGPALAGGWTEDTATTPSPYATFGTDNRTTSTTATINTGHGSLPPGTPAELFQTQRWETTRAPVLSYTFPVPAGTTVQVRVYMAETYFTAADQRSFDLTIEGVLAFDEVDIFERVGGANTGLVLWKEVTSDGQVTVQTGHGAANNPTVAGIEIVQTTGTPAAPTLGANPASVTFPATAPGGSANQSVTLSHNGASGSPAITIESTSITGADAAMFSDSFNDAGSVVLQPGQSTAITTTFSPTANGSRSATLSVAHSGGNNPLTIPLSGTTPSTPGPVSFSKSTLSGITTNNPTVVQFGPDGRLYVGTMSGQIKAYTITRNGKDSYSASGAETIGHLQTIPNHNDDGSLSPGTTNRLLTGFTVVGTSANPMIYAVTSDPRIGAGTSGADLNLDTNSGVLSRLTKSGGSWTKVDLVQGMPRSEENHTGNGVVLDPVSNTLYIAYGGNTNKGAPSNNFALLPEYALSAAILSIDLDAIGSSTYALPTLDDQTRSGTNDANDPFGGNDGLNQAKLVPGGPVQVYAPGFRNPYDIVRTPDGRIYTIDNGGNAGWGDKPLPDSAAGTCTNAVQEPGTSDPDTLHLISAAGYYGGHPNPTRANKSNTFNSGNPQSPVTTANPIECDYKGPTEKGLTSFPTSTNGLAMYTSGNFGGAMDGDLIAAGYDNKVYRIELNAAGTSVVSNTVLFSSVGGLPLDVTAQPASGPFPGTLWVADFGADNIKVFEPSDYTGEPPACTGADNPALDEDGDLFDNADEIDNGTDPCSSADVPPDWDGDHTSNLNDADDDNDGTPDTTDAFALDAENGRATSLPLVLTWDNDASPAGGILGLGFTGLMTNGATPWHNQYDPAKMTAGGAAGVVTVDEVAEGDALGATNTQLYGFQTGIDVGPATSTFTVHTRLQAPFAGTTPSGEQSFGLFLGTGNQDNYIKVVAAANGSSGGFDVVREVGGAATTTAVAGPTWPSASFVDLYLTVNPAAGTVQAKTSVDGGAITNAGAAQALPASWLTAASGLAVGIIGTSAGAAPPFAATWGFLEVNPG